MTASAPIVTRFAPSPTGYLHIGGARTALFNWLYARRFGGTYRLRIEDTDRARSTTAAIDAILEGLNWLGLGHDGEVVYQFARAERHRAVALQMLQAGHAYYCYATPEELDEMRAQQKAEGRPMRYDGRWRDRQPPPGHVPNTPPVVRLRAPQSGETTIRDRVQGDVVFRNDVLDDFVLLRGDGTPTYMLSVVVDDYDMGVTHVIRGDDHLTNAARQVQIIQAMDWPVPVYAHLPMLHGEDGAKLSKRHGAQGVHEYQDMGILPEAMRNYLLRLGWSHSNDEIISTAQALEWFDLDAIGRNPARVDMKRLAYLNGHYLREAPDADVTASVLSLRARQGLPEVTAIERDRLEKAMPGLKQRAKSLVELIDQAGFIFMLRPLAMDEKAAKILTPEARQLLGRLRLALADAAFDAPALEAAVRLFAEAEGVKLGDAAQPLRAALSGRSVSPPVFDVMAALGREESLGRLTDQAL